MKDRSGYLDWCELMGRPRLVYPEGLLRLGAIEIRDGAAYHGKKRLGAVVLDRQLGGEHILVSPRRCSLAADVELLRWRVLSEGPKRPEALAAHARNLLADQGNKAVVVDGGVVIRFTLDKNGLIDEAQSSWDGSPLETLALGLDLTPAGPKILALRRAADLAWDCYHKRVNLLDSVLYALLLDALPRREINYRDFVATCEVNGRLYPVGAVGESRIFWPRPGALVVKIPAGSSLPEKAKAPVTRRSRPRQRAVRGA